METHLIVAKGTNGIVYLDRNKEIQNTITDNCVMNYVTASRLIGVSTNWSIISTKAVILELSNHVSDYLQNADFEKLI